MKTVILSVLSLAMLASSAFADSKAKAALALAATAPKKECVECKLAEAALKAEDACPDGKCAVRAVYTAPACASGNCGTSVSSDSLAYQGRPAREFRPVRAVITAPFRLLRHLFGGCQ